MACGTGKRRGGATELAQREYADHHDGGHEVSQGDFENGGDNEVFSKPPMAGRQWGELAELTR